MMNALKKEIILQGKHINQVKNARNQQIKQEFRRKQFFQLPVFQVETYRLQYLKLIYLGNYYKQCAARSHNATGTKSPINGRDYTNSCNHIHHEAQKNAVITMSKTYSKAAAELRKALGHLVIPSVFRN